MICPPGCSLARESRRVAGAGEPASTPGAIARGTSRQLLEAAFQAGRCRPMQVAMESLAASRSSKRFVAIGLGLAIVPRVAVVDEVRAGRGGRHPYPWASCP